MKPFFIIIGLAPLLTFMGCSQKNNEEPLPLNSHNAVPNHQNSVPPSSSPARESYAS